MLLITGSGRSGSTFLIRLLGKLGLNLLPECEHELREGSARQGLEGRAQTLSVKLHQFRNADVFRSPGSLNHLSIRQLRAPAPSGVEKEIASLGADVVKSPHIALVLEDWLRIRNDVEGVIFCVRKLEDVLEFYRSFLPRTAKEPELIRNFYFLWGRAFHAAASANVATATLQFPRMIDDPQYLWNRLAPLLLRRVKRERFMRVFRQTVLPRRKSS